jgi:hypothetical protein
MCWVLASWLRGPLTTLTGKAHVKSFDWSKTIAAFDALKSGVAQAVLLAHPDLNGEYEVRADASIDGMGAMLLQNGRPIAFISRQFTPAERNYTTTEQGFGYGMQRVEVLPRGQPTVHSGHRSPGSHVPRQSGGGITQGCSLA